MRLEVQFVVFLCIYRDKESFNRQLPVSCNWNVAFRCTEFWRKFCRRVFTFTITNFTLIGYYFHYANVNSSPLNWKQYRFVSEETKQKRECSPSTDWAEIFWPRAKKNSIVAEHVYTRRFAFSIDHDCSIVVVLILDRVWPVWSGCEMKSFCCITGSTIIYSFHGHESESPWHWDELAVGTAIFH